MTKTRERYNGQPVEDGCLLTDAYILLIISVFRHANVKSKSNYNELQVTISCTALTTIVLQERENKPCLSPLCE